MARTTKVFDGQGANGSSVSILRRDDLGAGGQSPDIGVLLAGDLGGGNVSINVSLASGRITEYKASITTTTRS